MVRQRPGSAKGVMFITIEITIEDETGIKSSDLAFDLREAAPCHPSALACPRRPGPWRLPGARRKDVDALTFVRFAR